MAERDFYDILGVSNSADAAEIKRAYRKLAMKYHPDQNKDDKTAEKKFKELNAAYDVLKDDQKRAAYDQYGHAAFEGGMGAGGHGGGGMGGGFDGFGSFTDIFEDIFGGAGGGPRQGRARSASRGSDLQYTYEISLEDAYNGKEATIRIPVNDTCDNCNGSGAKPGTKPEGCIQCGGSGAVRAQQGFFTVQRTCPSCNGAGTVIKDACSKCSGAGRVRKEKTLKVTIPAGIDDGQRIRLSGEGEAGMQGGPRGDLYVMIGIKPHKFFKRERANLHCRVPIAMTTAALGGEIEAPTIEGTRTKVKIPAGTQSGQQFRLRGKGMSTLNSQSRGDMYIDLHIETPMNLTKKQQELLKALDDSLNGKTAAKHSPESEGFLGKVKEFWDDLTE